MYLISSCKRLDIAYAISKLSSYMSNPRDKHWQGIIRVFKYLRFTLDYRLHYTGYHVVLDGYSDANWISNVKYSKPHSGYVFTLGEEQSHGNPQNKRLLQDPQWNLSL